MPGCGCSIFMNFSQAAAATVHFEVYNTRDVHIFNVDYVIFAIGKSLMANQCSRLALFMQIFRKCFFVHFFSIKVKIYIF